MGTYQAHEGKVMEIIWSHGLPRIFNREKLPFVSFWKLVMLLKDLSLTSILWRTFFWWNFMKLTSSREGRSQRLQPFPKKHLRDSTVFFTTNLWLWNPPQNILQLCVGNFLDNVNIAAGVFWSKFGTFEKAGFPGFPDQDIIHSWLFFKKTRREQWNSKLTTTCFGFLTAHPFEKGENPKKEKVPLANDHVSGLVALNFCGGISFLILFWSWYVLRNKSVVAERWSSNTDNQQQIFFKLEKIRSTTKESRSIFRLKKKLLTHFSSAPLLI